MQYNDISQLPPRYQAQIRRKLAEKIQAEIHQESPCPPQKGRGQGGKSKYGNRKTEEDGIVFDSRKETARFRELKEREKRGEITDLRLQVNFTLIEGYTKPSGERVKPEVYKADFTYYRQDETGEFSIYIVEDVKTRGTRTEKYKIKKKQMYEKYRIEVQEV